MFTIGDLAHLGRVSVRMLRHYDAIRLRRPARVDPVTGYRYYTAAQLARLNRVVAVKDLGFTLHQVQSMIDEKVEPGELRGMLRLRRAQLAELVAEDNARLARVDARLRMIETEGHMNTGDVVLKRIPAVRVAELSAPCASYEGPDVTPALSPGFDVVDLPAVPHAATLLHHGAMAEAFRTGQTIAAWIDENGYRTVGHGYAREVYLDCPPGEFDKWVTEMQVEVRPAK